VSCGPVLPAYRGTGADAIVCPHCAADPGQPCTKPDGRVSRVPCVARIAAADLTPDEGVGPHPAPAHDFSEARHPREVRS
jgi:hypothetical protein